MKFRAVAALAIAAALLVGGMQRPPRRWQFDVCCGTGTTHVQIQTLWFAMEGQNLVRVWQDHPQSPLKVPGIFTEERWFDYPMNEEQWRCRCIDPENPPTADTWFTFSQLPEVCPPENGG